MEDPTASREDIIDIARSLVRSTKRAATELNKEGGSIWFKPLTDVLLHMFAIPMSLSTRSVCARLLADFPIIRYAWASGGGSLESEMSVPQILQTSAVTSDMPTPERKDLSKDVHDVLSITTL